MAAMKSRFLSGLIFGASLFLLQGCFNSAFYYPDQVQIETPAHYHLRFEEVFFNSSDGTRLFGWFVPAKGEAVGTVVHFHGNHGNQTYCLQDATVYYQHSERLYEAVKDPKQLWLINGCSHIEVFTDAQSDSSYRQKLVQFFMDHRKGAH